MRGLGVPGCICEQVESIPAYHNPHGDVHERHSRIEPRPRYVPPPVYFLQAWYSFCAHSTATVQIRQRFSVDDGKNRGADNDWHGRGRQGALPPNHQRCHTSATELEGARGEGRPVENVKFTFPFGLWCLSGDFGAPPSPGSGRGESVSIRSSVDVPSMFR